MKVKLVLITIIFFIIIAGCTTDNSDKEREIDLSNCEEYYDGCNTCDVLNGETIQCTERVCREYEEAKCIKTIVEEQEINIEDLPINEARGDYEVRREVSMKITSSAFSNNGVIPVKYTCDGSDTIPPLNFENIPEGTVSLVLIMDDPDVPHDIMPEGIYDHWVLFDIPPTVELVEEGSAPQGTKGKTTSGRLSYEGPCPPGEEHRYFFKLYALDTMLDLSQGATKQQVENAMQGHVLAEATLTGLYG